MISLRKAVAITATSALAVAGLLAGSANAQSSQIAINTSVVVNAAGAPSTVTGYEVVVSCTLPTSVSQKASFPAAGGGPIPLFFSVATGNSCTFTVNAFPNNAAAASGTVLHTIGGANIGPVPVGATSPAVPVQAGTNAVFSVAYPSLTVKKAVVGDEVTPGTAYPFIASCQIPPALATNPGTPIAATGVNNFTLAFSLKKDAVKVITTADFPTLTAASQCFVAETDNGGAAGTSVVSTNTATPPVSTSGSFVEAVKAVLANPAATPPVLAVAAEGSKFLSAGTLSNGSSILVTNSFVGDLIVSKVVTGDPKTSIAIYEINVSCNNNGPKETFLLKDRQSKLFTGITTGTSCLVSETRSDGADATYADNSGDNTTDGRVTIKGTAAGCRDANLSSFPDCRANVIVTNSYVVATTTAAATTAAPATAAPATAAPIAPAPVVEPETLDPEEVVTG